MGFYKSNYKNELFFFQNSLLAPFTQDIYMAFYLPTSTYFNDVNGGRNIYSTLNLKESFLWVATRKNETKLRKTEKAWKKKIKAMKVRLKWNEITDVKSLKPFEFEPKTNIGDINSSSSDDEEEGAESKVKRISNSEWCDCGAKAFLGRCSSK